MEEMISRVDDEVRSCVELGKCTWRYAFIDGVKTDILDTSKGAHGICPLCGDELISRQGEINTWHWAHKNGHVCDSWYETKGAWHRWWQDQFDKSWQEVAIIKKGEGEESQDIKHIADVRTDEDWVIECQYSSLSLQKIREREAFYGKKMVWVVSGTRCSGDIERGPPLFNLSFCQSTKGFFYAIVPDGRAFNRHWRESNRLVFLDYYGTFDKPSCGTELLCLLPKFKNVDERIIVRISQVEFVENFKQNKAEDFIEGFRGLFKESKIKCEELRRIEEEQRWREKEQLFQQEIEARKKRQEEEKIERERRYQKALKHPVRYAITLGWIKAHLLCENLCGAQIVHEVKCDHLPKKCRIAIHFTNTYSLEEFTKDEEWAKKHLKGSHLFPTYEELKRKAGVIVGKSVYFQDLNGVKTITGFSWFHNYDLSTRKIPCIPDGKDVWILDGDYFNVVNDCKSRKLLPCPKCGAALRLRKNKKDLSEFFGCSHYPQCTFTCNCDENGRPSVDNPWEANSLKWKNKYRY